jgi:hypothetical protein
MAYWGHAIIRISKPSALSEVIRLEEHPGEVSSRFIHQRLLSLISTLFFRGILNGKRVQANLGAMNHAVIMPDGIAHIDYR